MATRGRPIVLFSALLAVCCPSCEEAAADDMGAGGANDAAADADGSDDMGAGERISGAVNGQCVEPGTRFLDVYLCDTVRGPTPLEPPVSAARTEHDPEILADPDADWVVEQLEACSCTCCHREGGVGSYKWSHDFGPAWSDSARDGTLMILGFAGSSDDVDPDVNFDFSRAEAGVPTQDADRFQAFIERTVQRREGD